MNISTKATWFLILVTVLWGATFPLIKSAITTINPNAFVAIRLMIAAITFFPFILHKTPKTTPTILKGALILGLFESLCYICQTMGLQTISSANSAFITAFSVVLVPFISPFFGLAKPTKTDIFASLTCLSSIFILTGAKISHIHTGELWSLGCALTYAFSISYLQRITLKIKQNLILLVGFQILFAIPLPVIISFTHPWHIILTPILIVALIFCGSLSTCLTFFLQSKYQNKISINNAALIYAFEPVFATIFAYLINGEAIYKSTIIGGTLVFISFMVSQFSHLFTHVIKNIWQKIYGYILLLS
ncbi:carboxylate/amino acid/amine transporter [Piscirickettsia salmonis]|uniref:Transporter protein EamA n=1 Tax=Piscirickettsia salmonis TaxID=1238 RepID=A0AAC8VHP1_PISSA|nr:DMT family transporter [Piscirickettsia salmonis]AKP73858.1 hypothetical protein PSLF89_2096 [Piscirickettsia salmonis LF-89 = ATCC VR-1361]ALB22670.1 transporter protein EamA [Piscirickettsia salmonis]ALY02680.1 hypothetical protein AWE47_07295 [Piscirickettsia salmonis]AMA42224.1 hypothetical protein AWJ11_07475 [Piscirickettsia salmonis]AOS34699.1 hypothetical protein AVM72_04635 [Piscirickettsia salmonis]